MAKKQQEALTRSDWGRIIAQDIAARTQKSKPLRNGQDFRGNRGMRRSKKALRRVRHKLGEDVPDSGQEHLAHSDDGFLVTTASLDAAVAFAKFGMLLGANEGISDLNQKGLEVRTRAGNSRRLDFAAALVISWTAASP